MKVVLEFEVGEAQQVVEATRQEYHRLEAQRAEITAKMDVLERRIASMETTIKRALDGMPSPMVASSPLVTLSVHQKNGKRRAGENERLMVEFLVGRPPQRVIDISRGTQIGVSSVQAVLTRSPERFVVENGLWRLAQAIS